MLNWFRMCFLLWGAASRAPCILSALLWCDVPLLEVTRQMAILLRLSLYQYGYVTALT